MTENQNFERPVPPPARPASGRLAPASSGTSPGRPASAQLAPGEPSGLGTDRPAADSALAAMLEARTVALVGASPRPGSFGQRMVDEVTRSASRPTVYLVNPRYTEIGGRPCVPSLADVPGPVDLVLLAVPDAALEEQLTLAAARGDRSAVIFGNAHEDPTPTPGHTANSGLPPTTPSPPTTTPTTPDTNPTTPESYDTNSTTHAADTNPTARAPADTNPTPHAPADTNPTARAPFDTNPTAHPDHTTNSGLPPTQPSPREANPTAPPPPGTNPSPHSGHTGPPGPNPAAPRHPAANPNPNFGHIPNSGPSHTGASEAGPPWLNLWASSSAPIGTTIQDPHRPGAGDARAGAPGDGGADALGHGTEALGHGTEAVGHGAEAVGHGAGGLRERLAAIARGAGMQLCGAGCMGFVNVARGLRAIGYTEPDPLPAGPVALVTHSGSVFSALLRARRGIGYTLAVSSGQELVTTAGAYLDYALGLPETKVLALVLEAIREPDRLRGALARAAERDIPVVLLTVGRSASGRMMVNAHSGALAADDGGWEALARAYGVHRVGDLAEFADTVELFAIGRRAARGPARGAGIATVHDSGLERAHAADLAEDVGVPFAAIGETTKARLAGILDPGLMPANPLDVWGTGADTKELFSRSLVTLAEDPSVSAVALAVDLVHELDGDESYPLAVLDAAARTTKPLAVLGNLASAVDPDLAARLRAHGVPVLEGLRPGLLALRHLLDHADRSPVASDPATAANPGSLPGPAVASDPAAAANPGASGPATAANPGASGPATPARSLPATARASRRDRAAALLAAGPSGPALLALLRGYGIAAAEATEAADARAVLAAAETIGYPVVLKTADPAITHKSDAHGVILGISDAAELTRAYADLSARLGPQVLVCQTVPPGPELAIGIARDPDLGPLIVVGAGGVLVELLADRAVALPPVDEHTAREMIGELRAARLLAGVRGAPPADIDAVVRAITGVSALAEDLGDRLAALDVNPLICGPRGAVAVDALAVLRADD